MAMIFRPLSRTAPSNEYLLRVYEKHIKITAKLTQLLKLADSSQVAFQVNGSALYIVKKAKNGYNLKKCNNGYRINDSKLARSIASILSGPGTYRVEADETEVDYNGDTCYRIFFRPYEP